MFSLRKKDNVLEYGRGLTLTADMRKKLNQDGLKAASLERFAPFFVALEPP